jgi:hypothetical protein
VSDVWAAGFWAEGFWSPAFWQSDDAPVDPVEEIGGARAPRKKKALRDDALALGRVGSSGVSVVSADAVREMVRAVGAAGGSFAALSASRERVAEISGVGASHADVSARADRVPVFSDADLMALAVWVSRSRH